MRFGQWAMWIHSIPEGQQISRYDSAKQVEKSTGRTPPDLKDRPELPDECIAAWDAYVSMREHSWIELDAYQRINQIQLFGWEIEAIMELAKQKEAPKQWPPK